MGNQPDWVAGKGQKNLEEDAAKNAKATFGPDRFWLKPESSTQIVFVDDEPIRFYEHQVPIYNPKLRRLDYRNWTTCPGEGCEVCAAGDETDYVAAWTIVDRTEYTIKNGPNAGKKVKDKVKLLVAKSTVMTKLARRSERARKKGHPGLKGLCFEVTRTTDKSPNTGDDFELIGKATKVIEGVEPFDYYDIFAPNQRQRERFASVLRDRAGYAESKSGSGGGSGGGEAEPDDLPF